MTLPDQLRIDQGNEALWQEVGAGASGMVESGLGQDARNTMPSGRPAPMLQDMADELFRSLAPGRHEGMECLARELRYVRDRDTRLPDMPLTQWRCIELARAPARQEPAMPAVVRQWLETGRDDPLPEVRRVTEGWHGEGEIAG